MSNLTATDLIRAGEIMRRLMDPHAAGSVNAWRSDINRRLIELLGADSAGFILPVADGPVVYSDEHCAVALSRYPEMAPPLLLSGQSIFERGVELGVSTLEDAWGVEMPRNLSSAYHNDYLVPNRALDALSAVVAVPQLGPHGMAGVQLWHEKEVGPQFGDRERSLLRIIFPALRAGVEATLRWERHHTDLLKVMDGLPQPMMVCDASARPLHRTPALNAEMVCDPQRDILETAMLEVAAAHGAIGAGAVIVRQMPTLGGKRVQTQRAIYQIGGSLYQSPLPNAPVLVIVTLDRVTLVRRTDADLQEAYGLTSAELRVAAFLITSKSSTQIGRDVHLSTHTVRRHCESILQKTGARSRVELAALLLR